MRHDVLMRAQIWRDGKPMDDFVDDVNIQANVWLRLEMDKYLSPRVAMYEVRYYFDHASGSWGVQLHFMGWQ